MDPREGQWSPEEDEMLINLILNSTDWSLISKSIPGKSPGNCWLRWNSRAKNDTDIERQWSSEEDEMLRNLILKHGSNWSLISKSFPGKSPFKCLARWQTLAKNDPDQIESHWSSEEDEMLSNLKSKHSSKYSLISKSFPGKSPGKCLTRWQTLAKNDQDQIGRHEDITIGGQGSSYIHHGNLSHKVGGVSRQPPSISDFLRGNMSSGSTHSFSRDKSAPSWNALNKRDSSSMMIEDDDVQEFAGDDFGLKDSSEISSTRNRD